VLVLDASVVLEMCLDTSVGRRAQTALTRDESLHAPHLIDIEVLQVLRRMVLSRALSTSLAEDALKTFGLMSLTRHEHVPLMRRVWQLRESISAYDATYIALAEGLAAPLLTCDAKLSRAHGHRARIRLLE
jgi:predicted nucleic acid-binding protein